MPDIVLRRRQVQSSESPVDVVVFARKDRSDPEPSLRVALQAAQEERGKEPWSDSDPELWMGNSLVGRLAKDGDIEALVQRTIGQFRSQPATIERFPLNVATLNELLGRGLRDKLGVYALFRPARKEDPTHSVTDGYACLRVVADENRLLGVALAEELERRASTGATHFSYVEANLSPLLEAQHRQMYEDFQPLEGSPPTRA